MQHADYSIRSLSCVRSFINEVVELCVKLNNFIKCVKSLELVSAPILVLPRNICQNSTLKTVVLMLKTPSAHRSIVTTCIGAKISFLVHNHRVTFRRQYQKLNVFAIWWVFANPVIIIINIVNEVPNTDVRMLFADN